MHRRPVESTSSSQRKAFIWSRICVWQSHLFYKTYIRHDKTVSWKRHGWSCINSHPGYSTAHTSKSTCGGQGIWCRVSNVGLPHNYWITTTSGTTPHHTTPQLGWWSFPIHRYNLYLCVCVFTELMKDEMPHCFVFENYAPLSAILTAVYNKMWPARALCDDGCFVDYSNNLWLY